MTAGGAGASPNRFRSPSDGRRPLVFAHRGASALAPENTLEAGHLGRDEGADAWEIDVRLSRDGVPVVVHDTTLGRTTDVARRFADDPRRARGFLVAEFDLDEIRSLDAGGWFVADDGGPRSASAFGTGDRLDPGLVARCQSGGVRVPTLAEALALTVERDWRVNVELKSDFEGTPALLDAVLAVIAAEDCAERVLISSFDHGELARLAVLAPGIAAGVLVGQPLADPAAYVRETIRADTYHPSAAALGADSPAYRRRPSAAALRRADLDALRSARVAVHVFTINDDGPGGLADHLASAGVDGLFTDDPGPLVRRWGPPGEVPHRRRR